MKRIAIIGGGIAGLGAAYKIRRAADAGHEVEFHLFEKDDRLGGKLYTDIAVDERGNRFIADGGSDSFLTDKTAVHRVARLLDVFDEEAPTCEENKRTFIVKNGRLVEMPDGIMMFAPTKIMPMATTSLYSWPAKFRMALDLIIPRKQKWAEGETAQQHDEDLYSFVTRRMGKESLDRLAEPLVGGINGSEPRTMSLAATYPMLLEMEQKHGSLVKGFLAQRKKVEEIKKKYPPKPGAKPRTFFTSFYQGLQFITDRMADAAGRANISTNASVVSISKEGDSWMIGLDNGEFYEADAVIVATEGWAAVPLAGQVDERVGELVATIPCSSSATVAMAFAKEDFPFRTDWHGILSPMVEHRPVTGISLMSSKWPDRAPEGTVLLRGFLGGPRDQEVLKGSDEELIEIARKQFVELLQVKPDAKPLYARLFRWERGMPQYTLGHLDRVDEIEARCKAISGFALAGGAYRGVGVPNCLESGEKAVSKVLADFGITLEEDAVEEKRIY